ncbi:hypothetical protein BT96DRAFT_984346 [Gymnopus androsaceus JB14]|uniref:Uncharacterized protein n=1 Tax=Gymnopus androsaceus JB14 TaxID=1447944 RepID=A0A6A4ICW3_9AGAR|nr:hypothetical protein BT96DRAFT_984346 [Gymnopus androsaceus JB14]
MIPDWLFIAMNSSSPIVAVDSRLERPSSTLSHSSTSSTTSLPALFVPVAKKNRNWQMGKVTGFGQAIVEWRDHCFACPGSHFSCQIFLPPKQIEAIVDHGVKWMETSALTRKSLLRVFKWDSATSEDMDSLISSQRRNQKKSCIGDVNTPRPSVQPLDFEVPKSSFGPMETDNMTLSDENFFSAPRTSRHILTEPSTLFAREPIETTQLPASQEHLSP